MKGNHIDKRIKSFLKKSISVGHHNVKYNWLQIGLMILSCIRSKESFEEGAQEPSPQTLRDRLCLMGDWLSYFHSSMWTLAKAMLKRFPRFRWFISIDETYVAFFGKRKKLNEELMAKGLGKLVYGYKAKTPGATGSFCFLVISLCCCRVRIPIAIRMMKVGESYEPWLKPLLRGLLKIAPKAIVLADRGFGKATWFHRMLDNIGARRIIRVPLRAKRLKKKVANGQKRFQYWMTDSKTKEKALLTIRVVYDKWKDPYIFATTEGDLKDKVLLKQYLERWDIENLFKDSERIELPTSSRNPKMRLFCVVLSFFLFALWQEKKKIRHETSLRTFVKQCLDFLCRILNYILTPLGVMVPKPP